VSSDSGYDSHSDGDHGNFDQTLYEKKSYILQIPHVLFWRIQSEPADVVEFNF